MSPSNVLLWYPVSSIIIQFNYTVFKLPLYMFVFCTSLHVLESYLMCHIHFDLQCFLYCLYNSYLKCLSNAENNTWTNEIIYLRWGQNSFMSMKTCFVNSRLQFYYCWKYLSSYSLHLAFPSQVVCV